MLSRAEDMVVRARKLISRGEQLAKRRAAVAVAPQAPPVPRPLAPAIAPWPSRPSVPLLGVLQTPTGTLFVQPLTIGQQVCIAGDFNNWSPISHRLRPNTAAGVHELCIPLPTGRRLYRLVVDGRWSADPFNPIIETNPFGEPNSVAVVPAGPRPGAP
jgi:hypothetical protein